MAGQPDPPCRWRKIIPEDFGFWLAPDTTNQQEPDPSWWVLVTAADRGRTAGRCRGTLQRPIKMFRRLESILLAELHN